MLTASTVWAQLSGSNVPGDFGLKSGSQAPPGIYLAYLLYNLLNPVVYLVGAGEWYEHLAEGRVLYAVLRASGCAFFILLLTTLLNRAGFRLRL